MLGMGLLYPGPGYEAILHAIKTGSRSRNEAERIGMLALFQNKVGYNCRGQIATSLVPIPSHMWIATYCMPHERHTK